MAHPPLLFRWERRRRRGERRLARKSKLLNPPPRRGGREPSATPTFFAMMQLVAGRHGLSVGDPPTPAPQGLTQTALDPATSAPPPAPLAGQAAAYPMTMAPPPAPPAGQAASYPTAMAPPPAGQAALYTMTTAPPPGYPAGQQPPIFPPHRAPAALGAPPGEEAFPPQAPPCQRTSLHSLRAPFSRSRPFQTGLPYKDPPPPTRTCGRWLQGPRPSWTRRRPSA